MNSDLIIFSDDNKVCTKLLQISSINETKSEFKGFSTISKRLQFFGEMFCYSFQLRFVWMECTVHEKSKNDTLDIYRLFGSCILVSSMKGTCHAIRFLRDAAYHMVESYFRKIAHNSTVKRMLNDVLYDQFMNDTSNDFIILGCRYMRIVYSWLISFS